MKKRIRVLHFYKTSFPTSVGGVETFMDNLCSNTHELGVDNTILSLAKKPSKEPIYLSGYRVFHAKQNLFIFSTGFSFSVFSKFRKLANEADIIHYHYPYPFADIVHFVVGINKPTIITYHSDIVKQKKLLMFYKPLMRKFFNSVDRIISTSPNYFATSDVLQEHSLKTQIIPIGLNKTSYPPLNQERVNYWKAKLPEKFFLFIGALRYYKGLHIALEAIKGADYGLALAGIGKLEKELYKQTVNNNITNVSFLGHVTDEDKVALIHLCYGFIFPSYLRAEAFGISLLEAAMYGKPLISCEIGTGTSHINIDQETGIVTKPSSPKALRDAMDFMIKNPKKAREFGINAEKRYWKYLTSDKQAQAYVKIYKEIMDIP